VAAIRVSLFIAIKNSSANKVFGLHPFPARFLRNSEQNGRQRIKYV
jgi:hypothetical protein